MLYLQKNGVFDFKFGSGAAFVLVDFTVTNFLSIKETQSLSLVAGSGKELLATNTFDPKAPATPGLVRSSAIYGANASGKSNFIRAIRAVRTIVLESSNQRQSKDRLPVTPFLLNTTSSTQPSEFEITFISDGVRFQYGFSATAERVYEEWLLAFPKGRPQKWIDRTYDHENENYIWGATDKLSGQKQIWQTATRSNALFLSTAIQLNSSQLEPVFNWFRHTLRVVDFGRLPVDYSAQLCNNDEGCKAVVQLLKAADIDIEEVVVETSKFDTSKLSAEFPDILKIEIERQLKETEIHEIRTGHKTESGDIVFFDLKSESEGTQKIFSLAAPWLDTLQNGYVLFIDELHDSLHPLIVDFLIGLFHNSKNNKNNAQLVFITHDTTILNQSTLRRDQIWFCEKDSNQSTHLFPLTEFKPRKDVENIERSYLTGRYGALPYLRALDVDDLDR